MTRALGEFSVGVGPSDETSRGEACPKGLQEFHSW